MELPVLKVIYQRYAKDCTVACLAMLCGVSYENALVALAQQAPNVCMTGTSAAQLKRAARRLGFVLKQSSHFDIETDTGLLWLEASRSRDAHVVILWEGRIIDTNAGMYMPDVYFSTNKYKPTTLFVAEPKAKKSA